MSVAVRSPLLVPIPRPRTPPVSGPWQDAATVIANVTFSARHATARTVVARPAKVPAARKIKAVPTPAELLAAELAKPGKAGPARAAKIRALKLAACGCVLCTWAISPAATLVDHEARRAECARRNLSGDWPACRNTPPGWVSHPCPDGNGWQGDAFGPFPHCPEMGPPCKRCAGEWFGRIERAERRREEAERESLALSGQTKAEIDREGKARA